MLTDVNPCIFRPVNVSPYDCPTSIVVDDGNGNQVWPGSQGETCSSVPTTSFPKGYRVTIRTTWDLTDNGNQAPPGSYSAVGTFAWSSSGVTVQSSDRTPFTVS